MPVIRSLMKHLVDQYGDKKGQSIYYAMEKNSGGTQAGLNSALHKGVFNKHRGLRSKGGA